MRIIGFDIEFAKRNPIPSAISMKMRETVPSVILRILMLSLKSDDGASIAIDQSAIPMGVYAM